MIQNIVVFLEKEKLEIIREEMKDAKYHLVTTLDDIAGSLIFAVMMFYATLLL